MYENAHLAKANDNCLHEEEYDMGALRRIALALVIIGALNWGLIAFFQFDLVASLFGGQDAFLSRVVYALVAISGLICLGLLFKPDEEIETVVRTRDDLPIQTLIRSLERNRISRRNGRNYLSTRKTKSYNEK